MTNAELIAKIKAEIERLIEESDFDESANLYSLLSFLSTLESEKQMNQDEDLNEEIKKFIDEYGYERGGDRLLIAIVARHFAEWGAERQKEQDDRLVDIIYQQGIEKGKDEMRETLKKKKKK